MTRHGWLVAVMMMAASTVGWGAEERLTVAVLNYSEIGKEDIKLAVEIGRRVFHRMSIKTTWQVCRRLEECALPPAGSYLRVTILPEAKGTILGFADPDSLAHGNPLVYILYTSVDRLAKKSKNDTSDVLAYVIVHELLHLFGLQHAPAGVMRASFGREDFKILASGPYVSSGQLRQLLEGVLRFRSAKPESDE